MMNENPDNVKEMFNKIAPRYVLMNKLMTFGQDRHWRRELIKLAGLKDGDELLDVATGTGDVIIETLKSKVKLDRCTGMDFSPGMLSVARSRINPLVGKKGKNKTKRGSDHHLVRKNIEWIEGDALQIPFRDKEFTVVTSAYLMRNAGDVNTAFAEQFRILEPGGRVACLDTSPPGKTILAPLINLYLSKVIPFIGAMVAGSRSAYTYLPESTKAFKTADELREIMMKTGFERVSYKKYMFGTIAVHWGKKPQEETLKISLEKTDD